MSDARRQQTVNMRCTLTVDLAHFAALVVSSGMSAPLTLIPMSRWSRLVWWLCERYPGRWFFGRRYVR